jgi:transposase InsO family protein
LALLGVHLQTIDPHCPWRNGRIERFFGTLKQRLDRIAVADANDLTLKLIAFRACTTTLVHINTYKAEHPQKSGMGAASRSNVPSTSALGRDNSPGGTSHDRSPRINGGHY